MSKNIEVLNDQNFTTQISKGVTLVDFFASWCGPCRMLTPILDELSHELKEGNKIAKVDIDAAAGIVRQFNITSVPTLIVFKNGKEVERVVGLRDKEELKDMIDAAAK